MPRGDGTGPGGMGPMTGRAAGFCAGFAVPGYMNPAPGRGFGRGGGRGGGRGWRHMYYATGAPGWMRAGWAAPAALPASDEREMLEQQLRVLQSQIERIQKRLDEISATAETGKTS